MGSLMIPREQSPNGSYLFEMSKECVEQTYCIWEQFTSQYMEELLRNRQFLDMTGKAIENSLHFKQQLDRIVEATVAMMQLPTRGDMDRVLHKLNELEALLRDMNEKLDRLPERP